VPFILSSKSAGIWAVAVDEDEVMSEKSLKGLYSFQKLQPGARLLHLHRGEHFTVHKGRVLSVPLGWIF
jgi:hypothetical protein